jgi:hypothetical protein
MRRFAGVLAVVLVLSGTGLAHAAVHVGDWLVLSTGNGSVRYGSGGEFQVNVYQSDTWQTATGGYDNGTHGSKLLGSFYTFCASQSLYFLPGYAYQVTSLDEVPSFETTLGGWLFSQYWTNPSATLPSDLNGYVPGHQALSNNTTIGGMASTSVAGAIQDEIWKSLGFDYEFESLHTTAETTFGWDPNGTYSVGLIDKIMLNCPQNNYGTGYPGGQPQLYIPPTGIVIPEPASMVVWSLLGVGGWLGMRVYRRRAR